MRKPYFIAARWFATPSGQPGPEHDKKNDKEFQESIERGLREAKAGQKIDDVPEDIKHFFGKHERGPTPTNDEKPHSNEESKKTSSSGPNNNKNNKNNKNNNNNDMRANMNMIIATIISTYILYRFTSPEASSREVTRQEFRSAFLDKGLVDRLVVVNRSKVNVYLSLIHI